jgi:ketosteroid isomerase-like protein
MAHPDLELVTADRVTSPGTYRGTEAINKFFRDLFQPFDEVQTEPQEFHEFGNRIVVFVRVRSRPKGSTAVVDNRIAHVWTFAGGDVVRLQIFPNRDEAIEVASQLC